MTIAQANEIYNYYQGVCVKAKYSMVALLHFNDLANSAVSPMPNETREEHAIRLLAE